MSDELEETTAGDTSQERVWQQTLATLERSLREAAQAVTLLRRQMEADRPAAPQGGAALDSVRPAAHQDGAAPEADRPAAHQDGAAPEADRPAAHQDGAAPEAERPPAQQDRAVPESDRPAAQQDAAAPKGPALPQKPAAARTPGAGLSTFDRLWDRIERERMEKQEEPSPAALSGIRGLSRLPQQYLMTIEDQEGKVDLTPLHRALAGLPGADEISLVSYSNGVPVVSLRVQGELDLDQLSAAVSTAMDRECEVIPQDTGKLYLRMKAQRD